MGFRNKLINMLRFGVVGHRERKLKFGKPKSTKQQTHVRSIRTTNYFEKVRDRSTKLADIAGTDLPKEEGQLIRVSFSNPRTRSFHSNHQTWHHYCIIFLRFEQEIFIQTISGRPLTLLLWLPTGGESYPTNL